MSKNTSMSLMLVAVVVASGAGYWFGQHGAGDGAKLSHGEMQSPVAGTAPTKAGERTVLYYRNPMGLPDTSPTPKKDSMGMDYLPVYADEGKGASDEPGTVVISPAKVQKLGVRTERVERRVLNQEIRALGRVEIDERRLFNVAPRFEGWIERLHVNTTGQTVSKGQTLFEVYSPELVSAQREYQVAAQGLVSLKDAPAEAQSGMKQVAEAALARLKNWELSKVQIDTLAKENGTSARQTLSFTAPASGIVLEKKAVQGMRFMPGEMLYQIADLATVWVLADVFERDIGRVRVGQLATVTLNAFPGREFVGRVDYLYPTLNAQTRSVPVRIELANPGGLLRPAMYANVALKVSPGDTAPAMTVPLSAVIDSGTRQSVLIVKGEGRYTPRSVKLGARSDELVEVLEGLTEGDTVVVSANFLIDSESQLKAAFSSLTDAPPAKASHHAKGSIDAIDLKDGSLTISHEPVASLNWPAMTMDFSLTDKAQVGKLKQGMSVEFDFHEGQPGEWQITRLAPKGE